MKLSSIIVVPIQPNEQTRAVALLPSLVMQKGRASDAICNRVKREVIHILHASAAPFPLAKHECYTSNCLFDLHTSFSIMISIKIK